MTIEVLELEKLVYSLREQSRLLKEASEIDATGQPDARDDIIRLLLRRSSELARGTAALGAEENSASLGVLFRSLLETLISMLWISISTANAEVQSEAGVAELSRALKINLNSGNAKIKNRHTGEDATAEFLASERMKNIQKRKSVADQAEEAGVSDLYNIFYRFLSLETHGHQTECEEESQQTLSIINLQGIGAVCRAIGHAGVRWLLRRERTDNESLRDALGLNDERPE